MKEENSSKKWLSLAVGVIIIGVFIYAVGPIVQNLSGTFSQLSNFIDRHDVETGAYVYTDLELTAQASLGARSTMEHPPVGPHR